jgi:hypothetical protein
MPTPRRDDAAIPMMEDIDEIESKVAASYRWRRSEIVRLLGGLERSGV